MMEICEGLTADEWGGLMVGHKFMVGQAVAARASLFGLTPPGPYEIMRLLPPTGTSNQMISAKAGFGSFATARITRTLSTHTVRITAVAGVNTGRTQFSFLP